MSDASAVIPNTSTGKCLTCDCHCDDSWKNFTLDHSTPSTLTNTHINRLMSVTEASRVWHILPIITVSLRCTCIHVNIWKIKVEIRQSRHQRHWNQRSEGNEWDINMDRVSPFGSSIEFPSSAGLGQARLPFAFWGILSSFETTAFLHLQTEIKGIKNNF